MRRIQVHCRAFKSGSMLTNALIIILFGLVSINSALALEPFTISDIRVEGLQRISEGTVFNYLTP